MRQQYQVGKKSKCKISNLHDVNKQVVEETTERHPPGILNTVKKEKGLGQNSEEHQHVRYGWAEKDYLWRGIKNTLEVGRSMSWETGSGELKKEYKDKE